MKPGTICISLLIVLICSCATDVTKNPIGKTDFVVGKVYELKKATYLLNGSLMTLRQKAPVDSEGVLSPGERVAVREVVAFRSIEVGMTTEVFAEVASGSYKDRTVSLTAISEASANGYTKRDPSILEPLDDVAK